MFKYRMKSVILLLLNATTPDYGIPNSEFRSEYSYHNLQPSNCHNILFEIIKHGVVSNRWSFWKKYPELKHDKHQKYVDLQARSLSLSLYSDVYVYIQFITSQSFVIQNQQYDIVYPPLEPFYCAAYINIMTKDKLSFHPRITLKNIFI